MDAERTRLALELTGLMAFVVTIVAVCATIVGWAAFKRGGRWDGRPS
jgi:hypothetical protein